MDKLLEGSGKLIKHPSFIAGSLGAAGGSAIGDAAAKSTGDDRDTGRIIGALVGGTIGATGGAVAREVGKGVQQAHTQGTRDAMEAFDHAVQVVAKDDPALRKLVLGHMGSEWAKKLPEIVARRFG